MLEMDIEYTNDFFPKALKNIPKSGFLPTSGNPG
jgi:hypothetical protein